MVQELTFGISVGALVTGSHRQDAYRARTDCIVQSSECRVLPTRIAFGHIPGSVEFLCLVSSCLQQPSKAASGGRGPESKIQDDLFYHRY
jgi:hypothetical protein